jgi:ATP-binding cassette subfamily B multidrug efflux pump
MSSAAASIRGSVRPGVGAIARAKDPRGTLKRLASYFQPFKLQLGLVGLSIILTTLLALVGPYLMGVALDRYIGHQDGTGLDRIATIMLAAFLTNNLIEAGSSWTMAGVSQRALQRLRQQLFEHVQTLPMSFFDGNSIGDLMSRLTNDVDAINQAVGQNVTALLASCLSMTGILIAMFALDARLALASLLVIPIMLGLTRLVAVYTRKGFSDLQRDLGQLNSVMEETIGGQKVVSAFGRNDSAIAEFRKHNQAVCEAGIYANTYAFLLMPLTSVLGNLFVIVLVGLGGWLALQGLVSVGLIATFINYGQNFVQPLRQLSNLYNTLQAALAGAERVFQILDTASEIDSSAHSESPVAVKGLVRFGHVDFSYHAGQPILHDMNLEAEPGQMIALVGPTGAGKTTIINLLTRFYELDSGSIEIDGRNITQLAKSDLRRMLGLVLQDTYLFGATVMENIRYGRLDASDEEVMEAARTADAHTFVMQLPQGYQTVLSERASNLSQGQRQLLAIARTVLADPAILILDEATSSIDTRTELRIQTSLLRLMKGRTSFVIAHRLSTIRDADQVLVIKGGQIVERGTHQQLLDQRGLYAQMHQGAAPTP